MNEELNEEPNRELNRDTFDKLSAGIGTNLRELTKAVWRVTERMTDDVLKTRVRVLAEEIFELGIGGSGSGIRRIMERGKLLQSLIKLSEELGQVNSLNSSVLLREYEKLFHEIEQVVPTPRPARRREAPALAGRQARGVTRGAPQPAPRVASRLRPVRRGSARRIMAQRIMAQRPAVKELHRERQREIIQFLKNRGEARLRDMSSLFPNISQRMVRRILAQLVRMGNIRREGKGQGSHYRL